MTAVEDSIGVAGGLIVERFDNAVSVQFSVQSVQVVFTFVAVPQSSSRCVAHEYHPNATLQPSRTHTSSRAHGSLKNPKL